MKTLVRLIITLFFSISIFAQQGINYKAVIKDGNENLVTDQTIDVTLSILKSNITALYTEAHTITTDNNGIVILNLGEGTPSLGVYKDLDWSVTDYLLKIEIDIERDGTFEDMGNTALKAVPYALHANKATSAYEADEVVKIPEPYILGRSLTVSSARFQFNGKYGWQAAQEMCKAAYPNDPNVRVFTLEQIAQAIVLGNWDTTNINSINNVSFWAITPYAVGSLNPYTVESQNSYGLNYNSGDIGNGTRGRIIIDASTSNPGFNNPSTYLSVQTNIGNNFNYPCMCGTYVN